MKTIDWEKLKTFYYVAKAGSFTAAGDQIYLSSSALSRTVKELEDRLEFKVFYRHAKGIVLTKEGEILFSSVEKMKVEFESTVTTINERGDIPKGTLKITAPLDIIYRLIVSNIEEFSKLYPDLHLEIITSDNAPDFSFDKAELAIFPHIVNQKNLIQEYFLSFNLKLYASQKYLDNFGIPKTLEDLDHHKLISYGDHPHIFTNLNWHLTVGHKAGYTRKPYMQVNSETLLLKLAEEGIGIITLAQESTTFIRENNILVPVLPEITGPSIDFCYIYPQQLKNSNRIKAFKSFFQNIIQK